MATIHLHKFMSMKEHIAYAQSVQACATGYVKQHWEGSTAISGGRKIGRDFSGWPEVFKVAALPWMEGMEALAKAKKEIKDVELPIPESIRRRKTWQEEMGDGIDIHRLYQGVPYWRGIEGRQAQGGCPIVTVLANVGTPFGYDPEQIVWRGIAAMIITDILEDAGYRVELWACRYGDEQYTDDSDLMTATLLKESHGPLVEPLVVSGLAGWYYRTIVWLSYYDMTGGLEAAYGLGCPIDDFPDEAVKLVTGEDYTGKIFHIGGIFDLEDCVTLIKETIDEFNPSESSAVGVG